MLNIILGTAGHIDHGKSALVKALTGIDPDRLKEEKERGMTIDLGFADLKYQDGLTVGIVDVPGHERLIRNMLAGAGGIDLVLFVIAADESIMPQSREHLHICNLLKIKYGIVAITKTDLVDNEWLELVEDDVKEFIKDTFLDGLPIIPVSSKTMFNIELLKERIKAMALMVEPKLTKSPFRLPIDRVFTLKGFGTVITGTAISGNISVGDAVEILPVGIKCKVRGLHSHGKSIQTAFAGQRVAMNLQGVEKEELKRGDTVVIPDRFIPSTMLDAYLELLNNSPVIKNRDIVHFYLGTSEVMSRIVLYGRNEIKSGENCYCQFRLMEPVIAMSGDRYIIRRFSPMETIGGGEIFDPTSYKMSHKKSIEDLMIFGGGSLSEKISTKVKRAGIQGITVAFIEGWIKEDTPSIKEAINTLKERGDVIQFEDVLIHNSVFNSFRKIVKKLLTDYHVKNPLKLGMQKEELRVNLNIEPRLFNHFIKLLKDIVVENETVRLSTFTMVLSRSDENLKQQILEILEKTGLQPTTKEELVDILKVDHRRISDILKLLAKEGNLVRINDSLYITSSVYRNMVERLKEFFMSKSEMSVQEFKATVNAPRKYAITFLEYLDLNRITKRVGDIRKFMYNV
jgi:selenocysteine-specific elongation factor